MEIITAEYDLYIWQMSSKSNCFKSKLFDLISKADSSNLQLLKKAFPEEVSVYKKFTNVSGYWEKLREYIEGGV